MVRSQTRNAITVVGSLIAILAVILAYVLISPQLFRPPGPGVGIATGQIAPSFTAPDVNGTSWNLSLHRGQVVLIDFMGARCTTCGIEMSAGGLQGLYARYGSRGFTILSVDVALAFPSLGARTPEEAWRFVHGLNPDNSTRWPAGSWSVIFDAQGIAATYAITALPMKYLLDGSGKIVWKHLGYSSSQDTDALEAQITAILP
ncbi:MAG: TlpA family protein disulfide reductase [Methanobacteriota archaeon]|nr:MAG: TlpA family protein disulfide reductase [Euryarchaeota archaeon]